MEDLAHVHQDIKNLVGQKFYPCVAAVQSLAKKDYTIAVGQAFGSGMSRSSLRESLLGFLETWKANRSTTLSHWVVYPDDKISCEHEFEARMWKELSSLTSAEERDADWAEGWSKNPEDKNFTFCLGGYAFFVVGLHPKSSRLGRVFPYPALIFNVYDQFRDLQTQGVYDSMVQKNRERDARFAGSANAMAEKMGRRLGFNSVLGPRKSP